MYDSASVNGRNFSFFSAVFGKKVEKKILNYFFCRSHLHHRSYGLLHLNYYTEISYLFRQRLFIYIQICSQWKMIC